MNCHEAQTQIFAVQDGAAGEIPGAALEGHLAHCAGCRQVRANLAAVLGAWRHDSARARVPDAEREWHAVRRQIRGGAAVGSEPARPRRSAFAWLALPLGAAAAAALALFVINQNQEQTPTSELTARFSDAVIARADSVEAPGNAASTMVFLDDKSGWLIVLASDAVATE
ncbi:MAG: zf-HC2 domain-containing protein [Opitutaceae bacterium]